MIHPVFFLDSDSSHGSEKKPSKSSKTNHVINDKTSTTNNNDKDMPVPRSPSPMEVDCKEVPISNDTDSSLSKPPLLDSEQSDALFNILQDFVCNKLNRTILSIKEFKRLLLLKQTGMWSDDFHRLAVDGALE